MVQAERRSYTLNKEVKLPLPPFVILFITILFLEHSVVPWFLVNSQSDLSFLLWMRSLEAGGSFVSHPSIYAWELDYSCSQKYGVFKVLFQELPTDLSGNPDQVSFEVINRGQGLYTFQKKKLGLPEPAWCLRTVYISPIAKVLSHHGAQSWTLLPSPFTLLTPACPRSLNTNVASSEQLSLTPHPSLN